MLSRLEQLRENTRGWWVCKCGRKLYEHSRRKVPNAGHDEYICADTASGRFESSLPDHDFAPDRGVYRVT